MLDMRKSQLIYVLLLVMTIITGRSPAFARNYKTLAGVTLEGSFVDLKKSGSIQIVVLKLDRTGKTYEMPFLGLSPSDQHFVKFSHLTNKAKGITPASTGKTVPAVKTIPLPVPSGRSVAYISSLKSKLVAVDGNGVRSHKLEKAPDYYAFYFAASWCPACSQFTPQLARYYKKNIAFANPKFEIIFVSRDNSKKEMENYMLKSNMPFPALRYSDPNREKLRKKYAPNATPSLVLVDRSGKVISDSVVNNQYRSAFAVKQDIAAWFTDGERTEDGIIKSSLTTDKRVSDR